MNNEVNIIGKNTIFIPDAIKSPYITERIGYYHPEMSGQVLKSQEMEKDQSYKMTPGKISRNATRYQTVFRYRDAKKLFNSSVFPGSLESLIHYFTGAYL